MHLGIDMGSRTIKFALFKGSELIEHRVAESGFDPRGQTLAMIGNHAPRRITATGYGRHLARKSFANGVITEIRAHALGARHFFPGCRTVLDVGGQDSKVIALSPDGRVSNFLMNDKCAAGTGRFLEIMAASLGFGLDEFGPAAAGSRQGVAINSMCAVFAESEVVSLKNRGFAPDDIGRSIHLAVVDRLAGMLERLGGAGEVVFTGGVANNPFVVEALQEKLQAPVRVPPLPSIIGAVGAAIHAEKES
ncbi:MAG: 3-hydroxyacyl-ACP dehydratase [Desulfuromonadales bacterium]|nr:3-hydroxyacyl-ACP dehydratase [Desulfuromonadales bacterium]NIR34226.1 3-hydroxyacyl-ACP dehydratase [Desulfuromonadales bacterium]NIS44177.1 3-hydroxyacyl-ACP dehydratase [Desulfuromonadales bacterium]